MALLSLLVGLALLYVRPALSYWHTRAQAHGKAAEVSALERQHRALAARSRALRSPGTLEREARKLGYVKPGERAYVVEDLPKGP